MSPQRPAIIRWLMKVNLGCAIVSGIALLLMMTAGTADVIGTNFDLVGLNSTPVPAAFEFVATMMVVSTFMALPLAQARRAHIRVGVLVQILPPFLRKAAALLQFGLSAAFFLAIAWFGMRGALHSFSVGEFAPGLINFPIWPARFFLAFGALLMGAQCLVDTLGVLSRRFNSSLSDDETAGGPVI